MLAICADGSIGNVHQGGGVAYMEEAIEDIPRALNNYLGSLKKKKHGVIEEITKIDGHLVLKPSDPKVLEDGVENLVRGIKSGHILNVKGTIERLESMLREYRYKKAETLATEPS